MNTSKNELERINEVVNVLHDCINVKPCKLTKSGRIKKTVNNQKETRKVVPITDKEDIEKCKEYLRNKIHMTNRQDYKKGYARDLMLFCISMNEGLRVSDIVKLQWEHVFTYDGQFREYYVIKEKKTDKTKTVYINQSFRSAVIEYLETFPNTELQGYVFKNRQGNQLSDDTVYKLMKQLQKEVFHDRLNLGTHTMRKTFGTHVYRKSNDLALVQELLNHSSIATTRKYIGLTDEDIKKAYMEVNL